MIRYFMPVPKFQTQHRLISFYKLKSLHSGISMWLVVCLLASLWCLSTPLPVHAETISVPCNVSDLRDAITQANENSEADTLELSAACTYMLFSGPYQSGDPGNGPDGLPVIDSEITIQGAGATIARSTQPGVPEFRILELTSSANLSLYDITITGGYFGIATTGGGIYNDGARLTLDNVVLSNNRAGDAGGIRATTGSITTIIGSLVSGNYATANQSSGGGIQNNGDLSITDSLLSANAAHQGGGIYNKTNLTIANSTITGNSSVDGAGIYNDGGVVQISNTTVYTNSATGNGGGILSSASLTIINTTIYKNSANVGGGIYNLGGEDAALIQNSIIANSNSGSNCHGSFHSNSTHNLRWPSTDLSCVGQYGDPKLNPLGNYGGPTPTLSLQTGSKAMDTGDDGVCSASPVNSSDQRGSPRPYGPHCDIGSFEGTIDLSFVYLPSILR